MEQIRTIIHFERMPAATSEIKAADSFFVALGRSLARFFASVAASQDIIYRHENGLSRLPDDLLAAHGLDRDEIRRAIENSRIGF